MIGGLLLGSAVVCHTVAVEVTVFAVEQVAVFAAEQAAVFAVEQAAASGAWTVAGATRCDARALWIGIENFAVINAVAGLACESVLAV